MKLHGHKFGYCNMCGAMIICGYCGNNCCNAGSPFDCKDKCKEAYEIQDNIRFPLIYKLRDLINDL